MNDIRKRLLKDPTAVEQLLAWGKRHGDPAAHAIALARMGEEPERWTQITRLADAMSERELDLVDAALTSWNGAAREAPRAWIEQGLRQMRIARHLRIRSELPMDSTDLQRLLATPEARYLTHLSLINCHIYNAGAQVIARASHLDRLTHLDLRQNVLLGPDGVSALAQATHLRQLESLKLGSFYDEDVPYQQYTAQDAENRIESLGVQALVRSCFWGRLVHLGLRDNAIGDSGVRTLVEAKSTSFRIAYLDLQGNRVCDRGVRALAQAQHMRSLRTLDLSQNDIGDSGARAIARSKCLYLLKALFLDGNQIGDKGARAFARSPLMSNLRSLGLGFNNIQQDGAQALYDSLYLNERIRHGWLAAAAGS